MTNGMRRVRLAAAITALVIFVAPSTGSRAEPADTREPSFDEESVSPTPDADPTVRPGLAAELAERERSLEIARAELEEAHKDLDLAREKLKADLEEMRRLAEVVESKEQAEAKRKQDANKRKLERLITTVEKMDPEAAAPYLDRFKTSTAAAILHGMKIRKAAEVIANMPASKAATISRYYLKNGQPPPDTDSK